ncbi:hypothetical protein [Hymenobacter ruber]
MSTSANLPAAFDTTDDDDDNEYLWREAPVAALPIAGPTARLRELLPGTIQGRVQTGVLLVPNPGSGLGRLAAPLGLHEVNLAQALLAPLGPTAAFVGLTRAADLLRLIDQTATHPQAGVGLLLTGLDLLLTRLPPAESALAWGQLLEGPPHRRLVLALPSAFASYGPPELSRWQHAGRGAVWPG